MFERKAKPVEEVPSIPHIRTEPRYREATEKVASVQAKIAATDRRAEVLRSAAGSPGHAEQMEGRAKQLLATGELPDGTGDSAEPRRAYLDAVEDRRVLGIALRLASDELTTVQNRLTHERGNELRESYAAIIGEVCDRLVALDALFERAEQFRVALEGAGYSATSALDLLPMPRLGRLKDGNSAISYYLREAAARGYTDKADAAATGVGPSLLDRQIAAEAAAF
jgi:hypothetical protein